MPSAEDYVMITIKIQEEHVLSQYVVKVEIHNVTNSRDTLTKEPWLDIQHKQEIIKLLVDRAISRIEHYQAAKRRKASQLKAQRKVSTFSEPEMLIGEHVKIAFTFKDSGVCCHSLLVKSVDGYESVRLFPEKLVVFAHVLETPVAAKENIASNYFQIDIGPQIQEDTKYTFRDMSNDHIQFHKLHSFNSDYRDSVVKDETSEDKNLAHMLSEGGAIAAQGDNMKSCVATVNKSEVKLNEVQSHPANLKHKHNNLNRFTFKRQTKKIGRRSRSIGNNSSVWDPVKRQSSVNGIVSVHARESAVHHSSSVDLTSLSSHDEQDVRVVRKITTVELSDVSVGSSRENSTRMPVEICKLSVDNLRDTATSYVGFNSSEKESSVSCVLGGKVCSSLSGSSKPAQQQKGDSKKKRLCTKRGEASSSALADKLKNIQCCTGQHQKKVSDANETLDIASRTATLSNKVSSCFRRSVGDRDKLMNVTIIPLSKLPLPMRSSPESISSVEPDVSSVSCVINGSLESPVLIPSDGLDCDSSADMIDLKRNSSVHCINAQTRAHVSCKASQEKPVLSTLSNKRKLALKSSRNVKVCSAELSTVPQVALGAVGSQIRRKDIETDEPHPEPITKQTILSFSETVVSKAVHDIPACTSASDAVVSIASDIGNCMRSEKRLSFWANTQSDEHTVRLSLEPYGVIDVDELFDEQRVSQVIEHAAAIKIEEDEEYSQTLQEINATVLWMIRLGIGEGTDRLFEPKWFMSLYFSLRTDSSQAINNSDMKDLTREQLTYLVMLYERYLRDIFQGKMLCERHVAYRKGGKDRRVLTWMIPVGWFNYEQYEHILSALKSLFCKNHEKYFDYLMRVLLPEMLIKIVMHIRQVDHDAAELLIFEEWKAADGL